MAAVQVALVRSVVGGRWSVVGGRLVVPIALAKEIILVVARCGAAAGFTLLAQG